MAHGDIFSLCSRHDCNGKYLSEVRPAERNRFDGLLESAETTEGMCVA